MCGIVGYVGSDSGLHDNLAAAVESLFHRGPDGAGQFKLSSVSLGHTRLSIIDLAGGAQPLVTADQRHALVANGEIYNHTELRAELESLGARFLTHSDSEVILQGYRYWGEGVLERLEGMYAFALFDVDKQGVLLARDPLGMKPLYLCQRAEGVAFASEIKALIKLDAMKAAVCPEALVQYLEAQHSLAGQTLFQGVERLMAGEAAWYSPAEGLRRWRHWSVHSIQASLPDNPIAQLDELVNTVFTQHLRSDVPIGLFLSGGVDSSLILGLMRRFGIGNINTFSLGFPGSTVGDELGIASELATYFQTQHHVITPDADAMLERFVYTVWAADELMRDPATLPTSLLAETASREMKVVFSGEGGDEAFAGYGRYRTGAVERRLKQLFYPGSGGFRARGDLRGSLARRLLSPVLRQARRDWRQPLVTSWSSYPSDWSALQKMQALDLEHALPDNLLVKADRMLMAYGLEGRLPFVDRRLVSFGLGLPDEIKADRKSGKKILKEWGAGFMPADHFAMKKRGFYVPVRDWWRGARLEQLDRVLSQNIAITEWFQLKGLKDLVARQHAKGDVGRQLMTLLQFAIWHRLFIEGQAEIPPQRIDPLVFLEQGA